MKPEKFFKVAKEHPEYAYMTVPAAKRYYEATGESVFKAFLLEAAEDASVENGTAIALFAALKETAEGRYEEAIVKEGKKALESVEDLAKVYKVHPFLMAYDTAYAKKEHYAKIVQVFQSMDLPIGWEMAALIDVISVMSPEIYEHYRSMQDLFRTKIKEAAVQIGGFERFSEQEPLVRAIAGYVILQACENRTLLAEKYQNYGLALWDSVKDLPDTEEDAALMCMILELHAKVLAIQNA